MKDFAIGIDVGGTFTDVVLSTTDRTVRAKAPTDPVDIGNGVIEGCALVAAQIGMEASEMLPRVARFGLGTTAVTNALTDHKGSCVGLITTSGFESLALTARGDRECVDGWLELPWVPIEGGRIAGVAERIDQHGQVLVSLSESDVLSAARGLVERGVDAFAVSMVWSFVNPVHEQLARRVLEANFPNIPVFCGSELQPVQREYERTLVAVMNAFCSTTLDGIDKLEQRLRDAGLSVPLLLLQSSGGTVSVAEARRRPLRLAASGPAAGVVAAAEVAATQGLANAICGDMGGTSFDVAVIADGKPVRAQRGKLHGVIIAQPHVEVESVGSGGGSMAWIDQRGMLRVGPQSARSYPGPACYGRGGTVPTVTDAMVMLGYLNSEKFLGGAMQLDLAAAENACATLGEGIGLDAIETAWGIRELALADMANAMRSCISSSGLGTIDLAAVTYGGSGSLFMAPISQMVGVRRLLAPRLASVLSAFGGGSADIRVERNISVGQVTPVDAAQLDAWIEQLTTEVRSELEGNGVPADARTFLIEADMQFRRQNSQLTIEVARPVDQDAMVKSFVDTYVARYGSGTVVLGARPELATIRVVGLGRMTRAQLFALPSKVADGTQAPQSGTRKLRISRDVTTDAPVYEAERILPGHSLTGPALIDAVDNTLWVPPGCTALMDDYGTMVVELA